MRSVARWGVALVAIMALLAAGCSQDDGATVDVRPFEEVQASDLVFEADPSDPSRGIFRVTTTEPMICAIVWGVDTSFGRFNNSLSMDGTGIVQHDVVLPDVERGVTYTFVIQGTTADGTLYRSDVGTFRPDGEPASPGTTPAAAPGTNIAPQATVTQVSSEFSAVFDASRAIDDDPSTEWATRGDGDNGSITLDLGSTVDIKAVEFVTRSMADGSAITSTYRISIDGRAPLGPFPAGTLAQPRPALVTERGRTIRFDIEASSGGNVGAVEIRVYA